jgi:hypothetical protein
MSGADRKARSHSRGVRQAARELGRRGGFERARRRGPHRRTVTDLALLSRSRPVHTSAKVPAGPRGNTVQLPASRRDFLRV